MEIDSRKIEWGLDQRNRHKITYSETVVLMRMIYLEGISTDGRVVESQAQMRVALGMNDSTLRTARRGLVHRGLIVQDGVKFILVDGHGEQPIRVFRVPYDFDQRREP